MKKILLSSMGAIAWLNALVVCASEKFEILPDLPEPLAAAQATSISSVSSDSANNITQSVGAEPNILSVVFSLIFVILLIYATGIIYTKLNKMGFKTLRKQSLDTDPSKIAVISTTAIGNNKTLHVVELDGKRMLIGASVNGINLIKDLGAYPPQDIETSEFSNIEIPNIRIPKIEIPKIEFPNIGFTKASKKTEQQDIESNNISNEEDNSDGFVFTDIYEESPDGIIDKLFTQKSNNNLDEDNQNLTNNEIEHTEHKINPDEYALYKKYL